MHISCKPCYTQQGPGDIPYVRTSGLGASGMIDWEGILRREGPAVWKTAWKVLGNRADADECFQEACLAAVEYSKKNAVKQWRPFLHRLATTRAIDRLRKRARWRRRESQLPPDLD